MRTTIARLAALALAACAAVGCSRDDSAAAGKGGPGERAGREVDRALNKAGQAIEKAGRDMQKSSKGEDTSQK